MATTIRQNFILPQNTKHMLDAMVPKGKQSAFVAQSIEMALKSKKGREILNFPALLNIKNPIQYAEKIRTEWDKS